MTRPESSLPAAYFEELYARDPDPWRFATSAYELAKYDATLAALPQARYRSALEVGCSIGILTARLAERCGRLLAVDLAEAALAQARTRCAALPQVRLARLRLPDELPTGRFDLILLSEVVYYWSRADLARVAAFVTEALEPGGDLLLVHWTGATDYPLSGNEAAEGLLDALGPSMVRQPTQLGDHYRLDLARRAPPGAGG